MTKHQIEIAGESGTRIDGRDVARVSRDGSVMTLRHAWAEDCDARVWHAVRNAFLALAQDVANERGRSVEVYASGGWMLEQVEPEEAS